MTDDRARLTRPVASRRTARRRAGVERAAAAFLAIVVLAELALSPTLAVGPVADPGPGEGASPVASVPGAGSTAAGAAPADPTTDPIRAAAARRRAARTPVPDQPVDPGPSIIALDAAAHEHDRIAFTPGARVTVPFMPRADDSWSIGGAAPQRLPAGAASGRAMAGSGQGSVWARGSLAPEAAGPSEGSTDPDAVLPRSNDLHPVDAPAGSAVPAASPASLVLPGPDAASAPAATDLRRQVFGFLPYWELSDASTRLDYQLLRRSPTSASVPTPTATSGSANATARRRSAGAAGRARG